MADFTVMAWNVEWMSTLFDAGLVKPGEIARARAIAKVIKRVNPDVLALCEAANDPAAHQSFIAGFLTGSDYRVAAGKSRGLQDLVVYYRDPFVLEKVDDAFDEYSSWTDDVDADGVLEHFRWERRPLEVAFRVGPNGPRFRLMLVHTKSKAVFDVVDLAGFQNVSLGNRKKLVAQATRLRRRVERLLDDRVPLVILGDLNDGPGLDAFERVLGGSFVEILMGSVFEPERVLHNALAWMSRTAADREQLWTADFPDPIVNAQQWRHRIWIDHILASPDLIAPGAPLAVVRDSGRIVAKDRTARSASDHFAVHCTLRVA
jgi:endonuclease/exonuclease/phosphatase family metal-dependent hydrolase